MPKPQTATALANSVLEGGDAASFIKGTRPGLPQVIRDLQDWGWYIHKIEDYRTRFSMRIEGLVVFGSQAEGHVEFLASLHSDDCLSVALYDRVVWEPPIGTYQAYWSVIRPVVLIWHKTLRRDVPGELETEPTFQTWKRNWRQLRHDLSLRNGETP